MNNIRKLLHTQEETNIPLGYSQAVRQETMSAQLEHYHRKRAHLIELLGGKCVDCGAVEKLEFDHQDRSQKKFCISKWYGLTLDKLMPELQKCKLRCHTCHVRKTQDVDGLKAEHGKYSMYRHHKCRCDLCKEANRKQVRDWKQKRRAMA